jgi:hypothetical protein
MAPYPARPKRLNDLEKLNLLSDGEKLKKWNGGKAPMAGVPEPSDDEYEQFLKREANK